MLVAVALAVVVVLGIVFFARARRRGAKSASETSAELESWISDAIEKSLSAALGARGDDDRKKRLASTLRGDPDPELVGTIEETVRAVDVEYVRYAHESDAAVTLSLRYENGEVGSAQRRLPLDALPASVREALTRGGATRAFRAWDFPWAR